MAVRCHSVVTGPRRRDPVACRFHLVMYPFLSWARSQIAKRLSIQDSKSRGFQNALHYVLRTAFTEYIPRGTTAWPARFVSSSIWYRLMVLLCLRKDGRDFFAGREGRSSSRFEGWRGIYQLNHLIAKLRRQQAGLSTSMASR